MHRIDKSAGSHPGSSQGIQVAALQDLLSDHEIELVCRHLGDTWRDRIFTPVVTVRSMVHRALNPNKSIRAVLTDLAVVDDRLKQTPADASWCEARSRPPEELWPELLQHSVKRLEQLTSGQFLYRHRPVFLIDGSTLSMPDTPELVEHFGYSGTQHGLSRFLLGRITFASAIKMVLAYSLPLRIARPRQRRQIYAQMLSDIARCCNPVRPGRVEPRRVKRNGKQYPWLNIPRALAREQCAS